MTLLRGRGLGLEIMLAGRDFDAALEELAERFAERPGFYRGTPATAAFGAGAPTREQLDVLRTVLQSGGVELKGLSGSVEAEALALENDLEFVRAPAGSEELARRRALRPKRELKLSDSARSLVADFAGARADIADRRKRGETSVRRSPIAPPPSAVAASASPTQLQLVEPSPATLYHVGTLRGGQSLHHVGNIVVVGDVNPGTELIASGDVVVFGRLLGVAHAGAQGDAGARVYALHLDATQLRIATCIAANEGPRKAAEEPEAAMVADGKIVIVPLDKAGEVLARS
ncbi:MAG: septum site-determining protein MinC [Candidatus Baltobacteraceae bacterium]